MKGLEKVCACESDGQKGQDKNEEMNKGELSGVGKGWKKGRKKNPGVLLKFTQTFFCPAFSSVPFNKSGLFY